MARQASDAEIERRLADREESSLRGKVIWLPVCPALHATIVAAQDNRPRVEAPLAVVRFSADAHDPIRISFISLPVEAMLVHKESVPLSAGKIAAEEWAVAGVYVLLGPPRVGEHDGEEEDPSEGEDGEDEPSGAAEDGGEPRDESDADTANASRPLIRARPGMGRDVLKRVRQHPAKNPWFTRVVMARDTRQGWHSAEAGYLEGRLHDTCSTNKRVQKVGRHDSDETLQRHEEELMERQYLPGIIAALRVAGVPLDATWT
jgi:hypothetical protein